VRLKLEDRKTGAALSAHQDSNSWPALPSASQTPLMRSAEVPKCKKPRHPPERGRGLLLLELDSPAFFQLT